MVRYLIHLEWLKFRRNAVFKLMVILYTVLLPGLFLISAGDESTTGMNQQSVFEFPAIWSVMGYLGNWLAFFFLGFFAIYIFTSEFSNRTYRQNVITGMTVAELFSGKIIFLFLVSLFATTVYVLSAIGIGLIFEESSDLSVIFDRFYLVPRFTLMCFGYMSVGVFLSVLIRRTAVSVFLYFTYILFFEVFLRWSIHRNIADNRSMDFYPANAFEDLVPMPLGDWAVTRQFADNNEGLQFLSGGEAVITSIIYILILLAVSYAFLAKRDL